MSKSQQVFSENEAKRLNALSSYNILDTLPEKEYDAIARLASYICQVPMSLITFIDDKRQWYKAKIGIDTNEVPLVDSFCKHTILHNEILEISNALEDDRVKNHGSVTGEAHIRFYAGVPFIDPDGYCLGTLCVVDFEPRKLSNEQREALSTLAEEVISHLIVKKQKAQLEQSVKLHEDFHRLFNISPEMHYIADAHSNIEIISDAVKSILGYEPKDTIGKSLWDYVVDGNREQFVPLIEKAVATQLPFYIETQVVTADKNIKWIGWSAIYKDGKWYASGRDITYQKKILTELEQLSLVASKIVNGVVISDANDEVIWTNDAFERITGYTHEDVNGKYLGQVLKGKPQSPEHLTKLEESIRKRESYQVDLLMTKKGGGEIWISVINSVLYNNEGKVYKYIRVIINITVRKNAERDLEILSFAARESPSGMLTRDDKGLVVWMNEAMEKITGYTLAEMEGKSFGTQLIGEETDIEVLNAATKARDENKPYGIEILIYKKDRTPVWVALSNSPLFNEAGRVERQVTTMLDITERKKAEAELKLLSLVASNTTSGVIINNSRGEIEWVNHAFEDITGYILRDVKDKHLGDILQGELTDASIVQKARELSERKQSFEVDLLAYRKDRQPIWLTVINSVILDKYGAVEKYIEVIIDISAKKKVELELISSKEEAVQLNRAKDMFISVMSHEIRTPLNAVIGISHLLADDAKLEAQKENIDILKFSAENLMTLINDVLDFTKIETGNVELEKASLDLADLVKSITGSMQYKTTEKNIYLKHHIDSAVPSTVIGDRTRLSQILLNLVSNAVKFTDKGGVTIELKVIEQNDKDVRIRFAVTDTGIGIAHNKLNTIFESFKQAEADTTRKYGGTGLGLAISKRLIELHDSRVNVDSEPGKGSTFWFTITFGKTNNKKEHNNNVETGLTINVLVVDDNQINRLLINKILTKWGATIDFAENGLEAVNKIETNKNYDVVLMDIHMPEMGGLEATQIVRAKDEPYFKQLPIIALTASILNNQMGQIGEAGMSDYILKPFEPKVLFEKLSRYQKQ